MFPDLLNNYIFIKIHFSKHPHLQPPTYVVIINEIQPTSSLTVGGHLWQNVYEMYKLIF